MASNSVHKGTHKIQLLIYSYYVQRAVEVKLSLKSKRESEEKIVREATFNARHNTTNNQANRRVQTVVNREAGKPL